MSGSPSKNGVRQLRHYLLEYNKAAKTFNDLQTEIQQKTKELKEAKEKFRVANDTVRAALKNMDVESPGNFGYEDRLLYVMIKLATEDETDAT